MYGCFFTCIEHFLVLFDALKNEFYLCELEQRQHMQFAMAEVMGQHQKEILQAINDAVPKGGDPQVALDKIMNRLMDLKTAGPEEHQQQSD